MTTATTIQDEIIDSLYLSVQQAAYINIIKNYLYPDSIHCHDLLLLINVVIGVENEKLTPGEAHTELLADTRHVRTIKEELLDKGYPVGSDAESGYYWIPCPKKNENGSYDSPGRKAAASEHYKKGNTHFKRGNQINQNVFEYYEIPPASMSMAPLWEEK